MIAVMLAATLAAAPAADEVRYSNIKFQLGGNWEVARQSTTSMELRSTNDVIKTAVRVTITPYTMFEGTLDQALDTAWTGALAGHAANGDVSRDGEREVVEGGSLNSQSAAVTPVGGRAVAVVKQGSRVTRLLMTADTEVAYGVSTAFFGFLLSTIEIVPDGPVTSGAQGAGGGPVAGPDPSDGFDWDGPDWFEYGVYDHDCRSLGDEYAELVRANNGLVGAVKPRAMTLPDSLARVRTMLAIPEAKAQFDAATKAASGQSPKIFVAGAAARLMEGDPYGALAHMLAGVTAAPEDPTVLFNFASVLAHVGMPNESLAVLSKLNASDRKPEVADGIPPDAAISYLTGYDEMLRGNLAEAKAKLKSTIQAEPFLNEASLSLALIEAHQGGDGKATYRKGAYRFKPTKLVFCSNDKSSERPPVDDMFDTSKGKAGVLSNFRHPKNVDELQKFMEYRGAVLVPRLTAAAEAAQARVQAHPSPRTVDPSPYDVWADRMSMLMEGLDENEPLILKLQADVDASEKDVHNAAEIHIGGLVKKDLALLAAGGPIPCDEVRSNINQALGGMRAYLVHWELMQRRYARTWYRMTTGLNSHIGDPKWHEFNDASLRAQLLALDGLMLEGIAGVYGGIATQLPMVQDCLQDAQSDGSLQTSEDSDGCPPGMKGLGFKYSFELGAGGLNPAKTLPKLGFKVDCKKFTIEVEYPALKVPLLGPLGELSLGGFAQLEMGHKGDWSVFAGAKGSASAARGPGVSEKAGIYASGNARDGLTDLGGRVSLDAAGKSSEFAISKSDSMDFSIMPSPTPPVRGPGLRHFSSLSLP